MKFIKVARLDSSGRGEVTGADLLNSFTGVGFLGAGTIVHGSGEGEVKGPTTVSGLWLTAAIGVVAGMGREATAALSVLLELVILYTVPRVARLFESPVS